MFTPTDNSDQCASELREEAEAGEPGLLAASPFIHSFIRSLVFYIDNDGKAQIESIGRH